MDFAQLEHDLDRQEAFKGWLRIIVFLTMAVIIALLVVRNHNQSVGAAPASAPAKTIIELLGADATPLREVEATNWYRVYRTDTTIFETDVGTVYWTGSFVVLSPDLVRKASAAPAAAPAPVAPPADDHEASR